MTSADAWRKNFYARMELARATAAERRGRGEATGCHSSWIRRERPASEVEPIERIQVYVWHAIMDTVTDLNWQDHIDGPMWATERK